MFGVAGFHSIGHVISFENNFKTAIYEQAKEQIGLLVPPKDCMAVIDKASIYNDLRFSDISWLRKTSPLSNHLSTCTT